MQWLMLNVLTILGYRRWQDVDHDNGYTLQQCSVTGEYRTVVKRAHYHQVNPKQPAHWMLPKNNFNDEQPIETYRQGGVF